MEFTINDIFKSHLVRFKHLQNQGFAPKFIVDIGAHYGLWTKCISALFPKTQFLMIEANPDNATRLQAINYPFFIQLLGASKKESTPYYKCKNDITTGNSIYLEQTHFEFEKTTLSMDTLENVINKGPYPVPDFIKLDVQGAEIDILNGSLNLIQQVPLILMEVQLIEYNLGAPLMTQVIKQMDLWGFRMIDVFELHYEKSGHLSQLDLLFSRSSSASNCL